MKYRLEWLTTDDTLTLKLIVRSRSTFLEYVESEINIPLEALQSQGRASNTADAGDRLYEAYRDLAADE